MTAPARARFVSNLMDVLGLVTAFALSKNSNLESFSADSSIGTTSGSITVANFIDAHGVVILYLRDNDSGIIDLNTPILIGTSSTTLFEINTSTNNRAYLTARISNSTSLNIQLNKYYSSGAESSCSYNFFGFAI